MSSTAAGHTPARFGLPRKSGIPTPGRPRSVSGIAPEVAGEYDAHTMTKALADAMRANNPAQHRENGMGDSLAQSTRRPSVATRASQASSLVRPTSSTSSHSSSLSLRMPVAAPRDHSAPRTPLSATASRTPGFRTKTPTSAAPNGTFATPAPPLPRSSVNSRSQSRQSDMRSSSRLGNVSLVFNVGDHVRIESLDVDGILRFHGETEFKPGEWAGVELVGVFAGKGKNDGSVAGSVPSYLCLSID